MATECGICLEVLAKLKRKVLTLPCTHVYCRKCMVTYARQELQAKTEVKCPDPKCKHILDLKGMVGQKWIREAKKPKRHDLCPSEECKGTIVNGECDKCHLLVCTQCGEPEHPLKDCDPNIKANYQEVKAHTKLCPRCKAPIEKDGGCDHMHCLRCHLHFSWKDLTTMKGYGYERNIGGGYDHPHYETDLTNAPHYDVEFLRTLGYRVGEMLEPIECFMCVRLCANGTILCCWCADDARPTRVRQTYIDGHGTANLTNIRAHYCPLCK